MSQLFFRNSASRLLAPPHIRSFSSKPPRIPAVPIPPLEVIVKRRRPWTSEDQAVLMLEVEAARSEGRLPSASMLAKCLERAVKTIRNRIDMCKPGIRSGKWDVAEDSYLTQEVNSCMMSGKRPDFRLLSKSLNRTLMDVDFRWRWINRPQTSTGSWNDMEDRFLIDEIKKATNVGQTPSWASISIRIGRPEGDVRQRWFNTLDPTLKKGHWSLEEMGVLSRMVQKANTMCRKPCWTEIGNILNRSPAAVQKHWQKVHEPVAKGKFTFEEDSIILAEIRAAEGNNEKPCWADIGRLIKQNGDSVCARASRIKKALRKCIW